MGVSIDENTPKWMVYKVPLFQETTIYIYIFIYYIGDYDHLHFRHVGARSSVKAFP